MTTPEAEARKNIDRQLDAAGWVVQHHQRMNLAAKLGVAVQRTASAQWCLAQLPKWR